MRTPPVASQQQPLLASRAGRVRSIDNRRIAKLAKLAGAPEAKAAGAELHVRVDQVVETGQPVCTLHAETPGELHYALAYAASNQDLIGIDPE